MKFDIDINNDELKQCTAQKGRHLCAHIDKIIEFSLDELSVQKQT
jgi:hypothetical protein